MSALLTGDISREVEYQLLAEAGDSLRSAVLAVSHHGSNSSSASVFLNTVKPDYALVSAGYKNRYGHPHPTVLERLFDAGAKVFRSDQLGAVALRIEGDRVTGPFCSRYQSEQIWENVDNTGVCAGSL